jgi:Uma2 family endonuclease
LEKRFLFPGIEVWGRVLERNDFDGRISMSQPAVAALAPLPFELVYDDGKPLDTNWHRIQMSLFTHLTHQAMAERGRTDYFVGANMFVYFSYEQARDIAADPEGSKQFRGPDIFFVGDVPHRPGRQVWVVWEEGGRHPDVIIELLSPSTMKTDRTVKMDLYARTFRTAEYYLYRIETRTLEGFGLVGGAYQPRKPAASGRFWSARMGLDLGLWQGRIEKEDATWIRLFDRDGRMIPTGDERAEAERQHAEAERQRAEAERQRAEGAEAREEAERRRAEVAEAELARLRARLGAGE